MKNGRFPEDINEELAKDDAANGQLIVVGDGVGAEQNRCIVSVSSFTFFF